MPELLHPTFAMDALSALLAPLNAQPLLAECGYRVEVIDRQRIRVALDAPRAIHRGGLQSDAFNGSTLAAMFDLALGAPGLLRAHPDKRTATVQTSVSFMRAAKGGRVHVDGWIERAGSGILFTGAEARDDREQVCATASGVVRVMEGHSAPRVF